MKKICLGFVLATIFFLGNSFNSYLTAQSFSQKALNLNNKGSVNNGTNLMFGPDGRLYVAEYTGEIKIFTIERTGPGNYIVQNLEVISGVHNIPDHNDDGSPYESTFRETIGITVGGTSANPIVYVSSSDFRIGGGGGSDDVNLDTNSGIITRYTWNGTTWDEVDLVRGLPRSEENHATNEMELATINGEEFLIVAQGGHTNGGGPSKNFAYTTEYALSAAVLSVNLTRINAMPVKEHNGRKYIYDIPTLDDPTRPNVNGITNPDTPGYTGEDVNDPFGGNDGLNQAVIVPGGPVQIFSPGYRNVFGVVVTKAGAVYVSDNGANGGWGGFPVNEGTAMVTNAYDSAEPGSSSPSGGEQINNLDHLSLVTLDVNNYTFGSFYGGHPAPVRANPYGAGLYTNPSVTGTVGAVFRTKKYHPVKSDAQFTTDPNIGLPANWPPVQQANPVEGDWRGPGIDNPDGPEDVLVTTWGTNTNGIDEYTASNFNNAMKGNIIAGVNTGVLRRVELNADGSLKKLTASFASGLGGDALGITCNGDNEIFPGTIWVVTLNGNLVVFEPQDFGICYKAGDAGYDPQADNDHDGYSNQDETDNGTDLCNGASQPRDFDKSAGGTLVSDLNDEDDDNDGIPDSEDPFQMGDLEQSGSDAFPIPVSNELFSSNAVLKGYLGLGLTGMMNNGNPNPNWLSWIDRRDDPNDPNPNDILGGAIGAMTMQMTSGTALGNTNSQEKAFQYGVQVNATSGAFTAVGSLTNFNAPLQLYGNSAAPNAELGMFIGDGSQSNYIKFVLTPSGIKAQQELADVPSAPLTINLSEEERPVSKITFYYKIDPANGEIQLDYAIDAQERVTLGKITAQGATLEAIQSESVDLAVGMIGTSNAAGIEVEGTWDFLNVVTGEPAVSQILPDLQRFIGAGSETINLRNYFYDEQGVEALVFTVEQNSNTAINATISGEDLNLTFPPVPAAAEITIRATDADQNFVEQTFQVSVTENPVVSVLYRVNSGGPAIAAIDGDIDWGGDTRTQPSPYLAEDGNNKVGGYSMTDYSADVDLSTTPVSIFDSERYDGKKGAPNLTYSFPVEESGFYEVRLYMGNGYQGTPDAGDRVFDVSIEGIIAPELDDIDLSGTYGHLIGTVITYTAEVMDGSLDIIFLHGIENPIINGIEILGSSENVENPIIIAEIEDQINTIGEDLDGSLVVIASGGEGNLKYSISGAPAGVVIEPTNGQIGGSIGQDAAEASPYTVLVTVDDGDPESDDAVSTSFTWTILDAEPVLLEPIPDLVRTVGAPGESLDLSSYFTDDQGTENLVFSIQENSNPAIGAAISGKLLNLTFPLTPAVSDIIIRATDANQNFIEDSFRVSVNEVTASAVLYRVNAGGPEIAAIDGEIAWGADLTTQLSPYLVEDGNNKSGSYDMEGFTAQVDLSSTPTSIFNTERYDGQAGMPNMTYSFPVDPGFFTLRLYLGNGYSGTSAAGQRVFDVSVEGTVPPELDDIDLSGDFGHKTGAVITYTTEVVDGTLDISFIHGIENPLLNGIEILGSSEMSQSITISEIEDQVNFEGEAINNLTVTATGGDGILKYSMTGAPPGITIDAITGGLSGIVGKDASTASPYQVTITVDDSDEVTDDAKTVSFTWTISSGEPTVVQVMADISKTVGAANEALDLGDYFADDQGIEGLVFSVEENTNPGIGAVISGSILNLTYPTAASETSITIRATDADGNFVEQTFAVVVNEVSENVVLYRVNAGGPAIAAIDGKIEWGADTRSLPSPFLSEDGNNKTGGYSINEFTSGVDLTTTPEGIFNSERYDGTAGAPNLTYSFPVNEPGQYEVRLYLGNGYQGTSAAGQRVFDVAIEGIVSAAMDNIDLSGSYGHLIGTVISYTAEVTDGMLDISFIHVVENPLINGIEILGSSGTTSSITVAEISNQTNLTGESLDGSLVITASGGDGVLRYSMAGAPSGVQINSSTGVIAGTIDANASEGSPYSVVVSVDDSDTETDDAVSRSFLWTITTGEEVVLWTEKDESENYTARHECSFVQAGNEFFLMGGRESAKTIDVYDYATNSWTALVDSAPFEFNHFQATEYGGLIWVIGAFKDNAYPEETPADYIWAFDPAAREWIQGPAIPADRRRGAAGLVIYEDEFYVVGGNTLGHDGGYVAWFDKFNPETGTWTKLGDAPRARDHFQAAVIGSKLFVAGGRLSGGSGGVFKPVIPEVDVFDFSSGSWSTLPAAQNLPTPRGAPTVVSHNNKLLVIGGEVSNELVYGATVSDALKITEEYDPASGTWARLADLNHERHGTQAIVSGGGVYILAGSPNVGGGNQKNMEFLGVDAPAGSPSIASSLRAQEEGIFTGASLEISVETTDGNVGMVIKNIQITGPGATNYEIASGAVVNGFFLPNTIHEVSINKIANTAESADLIITFGNNGELAIPLISNSGIMLAAIEDQINLVGDLVGAGLMASATGGEGELVYSMSGAPAGVSINSTTGEIFGNIASGAEAGSPYTVSVAVDDSDAQADDAVSTTFTWIISDGNPTIVQTIPDIERPVGATPEQFDLTKYFSDDGGVENLVFTIEDNSDFSVGSTISGSMLLLEFPDLPAESMITVRASDDLLNFVEQTFTVTVSEVSISQVLYRINAGGPAIAALDGEIDWDADTSTQPSPFLINNGGNRVSGYSVDTYTSEVNLSTTPANVFHSERYAAAGTGGLIYSLPVTTPGVYEVRLYLGNGWNGTSSPGTRIFDVSLEGMIYPEMDDIDLSATYGHKVGTVISLEVEVTDGSLDIHFIHGVENPLVNAIEILSSDTSASTLIAGVEAEKQMEDSMMKAPSVSGQVYPNPASSFAYVEVSDPAINVKELQVFGYDGRLVKVYEAERVKVADGEYKLNVRDLPDGTFIVRVISEAAPVFTLRLVIQK